MPCGPGHMFWLNDLRLEPCHKRDHAASVVPKTMLHALCKALSSLEGFAKILLVLVSWLEMKIISPESSS